MKKSIVFLMCLISALMLGTLCAYADDADDSALTVTLTAADGLEIPQEGLAVTVYVGNRRSGGGSASVEWEPSYSYSYEHLAISSFYHSSDWLTKHSFNPHSYGSETVYIDPVTRSAVAELSSGCTYIAWHTQKTSGYIGSGGMSINRNAKEASITISYVKGVKLSGTVTVPAAENDVDYRIGIIGDVEDKPEIEYDYTFRESDTLKAGKTTIEYSVYVRPDMDYAVYLAFNDTYKMQHKDIHIATSDTTLDFTAERANKITGTITLPESYNDFKDENGEAIENIQVMLNLQDADTPHTLIDMDGVILSQSQRTAEFTLYNISDAKEFIVYYGGIYPYRPKNLCEGAAYKDNQGCTISVKQAAVLENKNQSIVINMLEGKTVKITVENQSPAFQDYFMENLRAIMTDGSDAYVRGYGSAESYYVTLPASCTEYILNLADDNDLRGVYYAENGFTRDISEADPISASETEKTVTLDRYEPDLPVTYMVLQSESNPNLYYVDYTNTSDFDIENVYVYTYTEYSDGEVLIERDRPQKLQAGSNVHNEIGITGRIERMYMFIWDENMRPLTYDKIEIIDKSEID